MCALGLGHATVAYVLFGPMDKVNGVLAAMIYVCEASKGCYSKYVDTFNVTGIVVLDECLLINITVCIWVYMCVCVCRQWMTGDTLGEAGLRPPSS